MAQVPLARVSRQGIALCATAGIFEGSHQLTTIFHDLHNLVRDVQDFHHSFDNLPFDRRQHSVDERAKNLLDEHLDWIHPHNIDLNLVPYSCPVRPGFPPADRCSKGGEFYVVLDLVQNASNRFNDFPDLPIDWTINSIGDRFQPLMERIDNCLKRANQMVSNRRCDRFQWVCKGIDQPFEDIGGNPQDVDHVVVRFERQVLGDGALLGTALQLLLDLFCHLACLFDRPPEHLLALLSNAFQLLRKTRNLPHDFALDFEHRFGYLLQGFLDLGADALECLYHRQHLDDLLDPLHEPSTVFEKL
mmetsp:Transcript_41866/g.115424  ORF Transcript_41866/g.115424 Transcript_41866/m.115424 type:complete len:303 (-) Transcript_41866:1567-2475(-)